MIEIPINNNRKLILIQSAEGIEVATTSKDGIESKIILSEGDMVMLFNYYKYVKHNDIKCDFVNTDGKNVE